MGNPLGPQSKDSDLCANPFFFFFTVGPLFPYFRATHAKTQSPKAVFFHFQAKLSIGSIFCRESLQWQGSMKQSTNDEIPNDEWPGVYLA